MDTVTKAADLTSLHTDTMLSAENRVIDERLRQFAGDQELQRAQARFSEAIRSGGIHFEGRDYPVSLRPLILDPQVEQTIIGVAERLVLLLDTAATLYSARSASPCELPRHLDALRDGWPSIC